MAAHATAGSHERRVTRRLEGRGMPGLGEALVEFRGCVIADRWRVDTLYAVGAEGAVYLATDLADRAAPQRAVKIPLVPYHRPAELSSSVLRHRRESLRTEGANLARSGSLYMPRSYGVHDFVNPLLDRNRGGAFKDPDPALVMELLPGHDVDLWLARVYASDVPRPLLRHHLDQFVSVLLRALHDLEERGYFYADMRPGNLRVMGRPQRRVRLLDAGSLVEVGDRSGRFPHVPHYLPVALFESRYTLGEAILPSAGVQAVMAGRTLYEVATGRVPVPGRALEPIDVATAGVSAAVADVIDGLASGSFRSVAQALKYLSRRRAPSPAPAAAARPALELAAPAAPSAAVLPPSVVAMLKPPAAPRTRPSLWRRMLASLTGRGAAAR